MAMHTPPDFSIGDQVSVNLELDVFQALQGGHSRWKPEMAKCMGRVGNVLGMGPGYVEVQFSSDKWQLHPAALSKMESFQPGDGVRVLDDEQSLRDLQKDHGGWVTAMAKSLGQEGIVRKVYPDKDVRVEVGGATWTFNPLCLKPKLQNRVASQSSKDISSSLSSAFFSAAGKGDLMAMENLLKVGGKMDEVARGGRTALHIACLESKPEVVQFLLSRGLDSNKTDNEGKSPLHLCVEGNAGGKVAECVAALLNSGCNPNAVDKEGRTALWMASESGAEEVIKSLLDSGRALPDLNIQNLAGDTPLHLASRAGHHGIVDLLLCNKADPHIPNVRGYNCMHLAALSGNEKVIDVIARQNKDLLNTRESSGLAPIHLAIYANKPKSLNKLLEYRELDRDSPFLDGDTPLIIACKEAMYHFIEPLVEKQASISVVDQHGNMPLHWVCSPHKPFLYHQEIEDTSEIKLICEAMKKTKFRDMIHLAAAAYLIKHEAPYDVTNHSDKTALDMLAEDSKAFLEPYTFDIRQLPDCVLCEKDKAIYRNDPCGHVTYCQTHATPGIKCVECRTKIVSYISLLPMQDLLGSLQPESTPEPTLPAESKRECSICYENCSDDRKMVAFDPCGHTSCKPCSERLDDCHVCRSRIGRKIVLHIV